MALIKCPECKKKISDQCEKCPNCGYPLDKICEVDENQTTDIENSNEGTAKSKKSFEIKSLIKKWWFWVAVGVVIAAITTTTILLLNRDTKPKFDKEGNPVFVELTNEVYTNAQKYKGYHINIKGKVFQVIGDNGSVKGIQIWIDPDTCEQNMMIYYSTDVEVKQGDYIMCSGYIDSVTEYKNAYDAKLYAPLVISSDLGKATYIDVMSPTTATITPENLKQENYGYSISIDKIEFAEKETRVYATVTNNGKASLNIGDTVIVQDGKQYNSTDNYEADYEGIPYEIVTGVSCSGIIVFPAITTNEFELTFDVHSADYNEELEKFVFKISNNPSTEEAPTEIKPTESTQNQLPTESQVIPQPISRNQQAVEEAVNQANRWFPTDRHWIIYILQNPSAQEGFDEYSYEEAVYAVENANIDWKNHALYTAKEYIENNTDFNHSQRDIHYTVEESGGDCSCAGYTEEEIMYAVYNCGIEWKTKAISDMNEYWDYDYSVIVTYYDFYDYLSGLGYYDDIIEYALNNTSGYYRGEAVANEQERVALLLTYGYTREAIINWYSEKLNMDYLEAVALVDSVCNINNSF